MNAGNSAGSGSTDAPVRRMTAGAGKYLVYQVYSDVSRETVWGNTTPTGRCAYRNWRPSNPYSLWQHTFSANSARREITVTRSTSQLLTDAVTSTQAIWLIDELDRHGHTPIWVSRCPKYIQSVGENLIKQQNYKRLYTFNRFFIIFMNYTKPKISAIINKGLVTLNAEKYGLSVKCMNPENSTALSIALLSI